jgi:hypothetical protein
MSLKQAEKEVGRSSRLEQVVEEAYGYLHLESSLVGVLENPNDMMRAHMHVNLVWILQ